MRACQHRAPNMARLSTLDFCVLAGWSLMLSCSAAKRENFPQNATKSWVDARRHCQLCFEELVTLTPENIQNIAKGLTTEHWTGLRKRPVNASDNSYLYPYNDTTAFWSGWANGDPLTFQNWYPGYPVFKSPYPRKDCCSCSCTCPAKPTTGPTTPFTATTNISRTTPTMATSLSTAAPVTYAPAFESECVRKPMLFQDAPDPDENYIEDPCVAMLGFGAWVEKKCAELLPFICYEDRFDGSVDVTDITSTSASISWEEGPGDIDHYRVEVNGSVYKDKLKGPSLTYALSNLTAGTPYSVQVFPVKCGRDLNPENKTFYTVPNKVTGIRIISQTEKCVSLNWTRPMGSVDLYSVQTRELKDPIVNESQNAEVCDLTPGSLHTFSVRSRINDRSQESEDSTVDAYTKPAQVSILKPSKITDSSLVLSWDKPQGNATGYRVTTSWKGKQEMEYINETVEDGGENTLSLEDLPSGTNITMSIVALANDTLVGQSRTAYCVTIPKAITHLNLTSTKDTITAVWDYAKGSPLFTVKLELEGVLEKTVEKISDATVTFTKVKSAANYTVIVYSVTGETESREFIKSVITLPTPPRDPKLSGKSKQDLTFSWTPPINTKTVDYLVTLESSFWGQKLNKTLNNETTHTFNNLKSGTNYTFEVKTVTEDQESDAAALTAATDSSKREITLSMVCSSQSSLLCEDEDTKNSAFVELQKRFQNLLGHHVFWELETAALENNR